MNNDVTYIAIILGLFVLAFALVAVCDRIIGVDADALRGADGGAQAGSESPVDEQVAA